MEYVGYALTCAACVATGFFVSKYLKTENVKQYIPGTAEYRFRVIANKIKDYEQNLKIEVTPKTGKYAVMGNLGRVSSKTSIYSTNDVNENRVAFNEELTQFFRDMKCIEIDSFVLKSFDDVAFVTLSHMTNAPITVKGKAVELMKESRVPDTLTVGSVTSGVDRSKMRLHIYLTINDKTDTIHTVTYTYTKYLTL